MSTVTIRNRTNGPFDIPTRVGSVFLPAFGEVSSDSFDPDYLSILKSSLSVEVVKSGVAGIPGLSGPTGAPAIPPIVTHVDLPGPDGLPPVVMDDMRTHTDPPGLPGLPPVVPAPLDGEILPPVENPEAV